MFEIYQRLNYDWADTRTNDFLLITSPFKVLTILALYLWFCLKAGPHFMKNREPFNLRTTLIVYNAFQIVTSVWFSSVGIWYFVYKYSLICEPIDYSNNPDALYIVSWAHLWFLSKITELLDTVFFVLRKKTSQVSGLHLYHHITTVIAVWMAAKYWGGGHAVFSGLLNSMVHVIMYTYYLIAGLGPEYQKYITWKKYITQIQLIQFVIILIHGLQALIGGCDFPKSFILLQITQGITFLILFFSFYTKSYNHQKKVRLQ